MLEVHSVRKDSGYPVRWYCLYRTKPGMWEELFITGPDEAFARAELQRLYEIGWIK